MRKALRTAKILWLAGTTVLSLLTVVAANGGLIDPRVWIVPSILAMMFPICIIANCVAGIVNLFVSRKGAIVQLGALLLSINGLAAFCPVNYPKPAVASVAPENLLRCMTYNVYGFQDTEKVYPDSTNRAVSQIIASDADIITLQEAYLIKPDVSSSITEAQLDTLNNIYPYQVNNVEGFFILSKHPLRHIDIPLPKSLDTPFEMAETEYCGIKLLIVNVHLKSIGLTDSDKQGYLNITSGQDEDSWKSDSKTLYHKLADAFRQRAIQAEFIAAKLDSLAYDNVLLCGDFNDIADCYAMRRICRRQMKSAYTTAGSGSMITYHDNRFYFHIDHILYQGTLRPLIIERGRIPSSDHYPLYCTFLIGH